MSYAYRWTIFAGIFWLIFQIDPRLAQIAAALVVLTLLVRPMIATVRFVRQTDARPIWAATFLTCLVGLLALLVVPFENRLLMAGNVIRYETQDRIATEPARLVVAHDGRVSLHSPALEQHIADLELHGALLENARGASFASPTELARMQAEQDALQDALTQLAQRKSRLVLASQQDIWTNAGASAHNAAWVTSRSGRLGSVSVPVAPSIRLTFAQTSAIAEHLLTAGTIVDVRSHLDPSCMFQGRITTLNAAQVARGGVVTLDADPVSPADSCFEKLPNGARLVARAVMPDRALFYRAWLALAQTLQNRLPI